MQHVINYLLPLLGDTKNENERKGAVIAINGEDVMLRTNFDSIEFSHRNH